jgi:hypothetical protein
MTNNFLRGGSSFGTIISDALAGFAGSGSGQRAIYDIVPHISTQEVHRDELQITQHPVETGTPVTDHAFPQPYTVEMHVCWSDSTAQTSGYVQAVYKALLAVQLSRQPITIATGKRLYSSMLIKSVMVNTDVENEYALSVVVLVQQIVITNTQTKQASVPNTDGSTQVGSTTPPDATATPSSANVTFDNGIGTIPSGSITGAPGGEFVWPNDITGSGSVNLNAAGPGAPTVESLTANGGL